MNIKQFVDYTKGESKLVKECANEYMESLVQEVASEYGVNKSVAKFILMKSINYNCVKESIKEQIDFMNEEGFIYENN